jgi:hypothetical protein
LTFKRLDLQNLIFHPCYDAVKSDYYFYKYLSVVFVCLIRLLREAGPRKQKKTIFITSLADD